MVPPCMVLSPIRAAGIPPKVTVVDPTMMLSGGPTQVQVSPTTEAGVPPMRTVGQPGPTIGPPTWGMGGVPGVTIGHTCISVSRAAGCPIRNFLCKGNPILAQFTPDAVDDVGQVNDQGDFALFRLTIFGKFFLAFGAFDAGKVHDVRDVAAG